MKHIKRITVSIFIVLFIVAAGFYVWAQDLYVVPILMYHSISLADTKPLMVMGYPRQLKLRLNNVSPQSFDTQMGYLKNNGYRVIPLSEYIEGRQAGRKFSHKTVVITFDDGYADNYTNAFPVLKKYRFPATIFLISDYLSRGPMFLSSDQVKEMSRQGISFGSHTRRHAYLPSLSQAQLIDEIVESKHDLEKNLGQPIDYIAYPCGGFSDQVKTIAAQAGYKAAVATNRGMNRFNLDLYELRRIHINSGDSEWTLNGKLSGYYNLFRELKPSH